MANQKEKKPIDYSFFYVIYNMFINKEYEERMNKVLQESAKVGHVSNRKWLEQSKNVPQEVVTFHNGEQTKLENATKHTKLKTIRPTRNHPTKLQHIKTKP